MRIVLAVGMLLVIGFAGCIGDDGLETDSETDVQAEYKGMDPRKSMPDRQFEPKLIFDTKLYEIEQGDTAILEFDITDIEDYPFPVTFIDWNVTYNREPNPVEEGDATQLPGTWNRTLHAEDYHLFRFNVDDGQGFKANQTIIIKVGNPPEIEGDIEEVLEEAGAEGSLAEVERAIDTTILTVSSCSHVCNEATAMKAAGIPVSFPCAGLAAMEQGVDCAWVQLPASAAGAPYTVGSDFPLDDAEAAFFDSCHVDANYVGDHIGGGPQAGVVPEGSVCLVAWEYAGAASALHITVGPWVESYEFEPAGPFEETKSITISCSYAGADACDFAGPKACVGFQDGFNGLDCVWWELTPAMAGTSYKVSSSAGDPDLAIFNKCSPNGFQIKSTAADGAESGVIPEGAGCLIAWEWGSAGGGSDITFQLDAWKEHATPVLHPFFVGMEDRGWYFFDPATSMCHVVDYTAVGGTLYVSSLGGGTWLLAETNGVPGLQVADDGEVMVESPGSAADCAGGDSVLI